MLKFVFYPKVELQARATQLTQLLHEALSAISHKIRCVVRAGELRKIELSSYLHQQLLPSKCARPACAGHACPDRCVIHVRDRARGLPRSVARAPSPFTCKSRGRGLDVHDCTGVLGERRTRRSSSSAIHYSDGKHPSLATPPAWVHLFGLVA